MFYTINNSFVDDFLNEVLTTKPARKTNFYKYSQFDVEVTEDGKQKVTVNTIGHNPKDITVDVTEEEVTIKSTKGENSSKFVKDIDLTLTVGADYDGTKSTAKFENGLLTLLIDKKVNKKAKTLKISY
jgi:HSP20 family molecular chaperone IbpA